MREVLFRAKRLDNGEWIEGYYASKGKGTDLEKHFIVSSTFDSNTNAYPFYFTDIEVDPKTVCQWTGLTDKNNRKIFERDILSHDEVGNIKVQFKNSEFLVHGITHNMFSTLLSSVYRGCEIIGNIFDNPELIGEQP